MTGTPPSSERRHDLDGLRGVAVLLVVCFHAGFPVLRGAFVAVDVFFVLSGFFLATMLAKKLALDEQIRAADVIARRVWRLLPAMLAMLTVTLATVMVFYAPIDRGDAASNVGVAALFLSNVVFAARGVNYFSSAENPALHTWTLGVEIQLVVVTAVLVTLLSRYGAKRAGDELGPARRMTIVNTVIIGLAVAAVASFAASVLISGSSPMWAYFGPHTRLWSFCAGAILGFVAGGGQSVAGSSASRVTMMQFAGLALILVPAFVYDRTMPYPGAIALLPVAGTLLLIAGGTIATTTVAGQALAWSGLASLGRVSYGWYLWHWPLMVLAATLFPSITPWGRFAWGCAGLGVAFLSTRYVERSAAKKFDTAFRVRAIRHALGACAVVFVIAQVAARMNGADNARQRAFAAARNDRMDHSCWARSAETRVDVDCAFGDASATTRIALLGDSHAEHWLGGLDAAGKERGWRIDAHVMGGCPVSDFSGTTSGAASRRYGECNRYREAMLTKIVAERPDAVMLSSFDYYIETKDGERIDRQVSEKVWTDGLRRTYSRLSAAGIPVIVIRGTPKVPFDVPSCLSRREARMMFATDCTYRPDREFISRARRAQDIAAQGLNVRFIDMNDQICASDRCAVERNGMVMFTDDNHLTRRFSQSTAPVLGARVSSARAPFSAR
jgi:peptidoglycan/LPS O-acetylase OafA/YrhL